MNSGRPRSRKRRASPRPQHGILRDQRAIEIAGERLNVAGKLGRKRECYLTVLMNSTSDFASVCETWPGLIVALMIPGW